MLENRPATERNEFRNKVLDYRLYAGDIFLHWARLSHKSGSRQTANQKTRKVENNEKLPDRRYTIE